MFTDERAGKISLRLQGLTVKNYRQVTAYIELSGRKWEAGLYEEAHQAATFPGREAHRRWDPPIAFQLDPADARR